MRMIARATKRICVLPNSEVRGTLLLRKYNVHKMIRFHIPFALNDPPSAFGPTEFPKKAAEGHKTMP